METTLNITDITIDMECQFRVDEINPDVVDDYAEAMKAGAAFPAITVFRDETTYWLSDGFHRVAAAKKAGAETIAADVRQGGKRDAWLHSLGVNDTHGLRRSPLDKRNAVEQALGDPELTRWSDREIAKQCGVTHPFVAKVRKSLETNPVTERTYTDRWGNTSTMDTDNIATANAERGKAGVPVSGDLAGAIRRLIVMHGATEFMRAATAIAAELEATGYH